MGAISSDKKQACDIEDGQHISRDSLSKDSCCAEKSVNVSQHEEEAVSNRQWWAATMLLVVAVISYSSMGPSFVYMNKNNVKPILAAAWRNVFIVGFVMIPALIEMYTTLSYNIIRSWFMNTVSEIVEKESELKSVSLNGPAGVLTPLSSSSQGQYMSLQDDTDTETEATPVPVDMNTAFPLLPRSTGHWTERPLVQAVFAAFFGAAALATWVTSLRFTNTVIASLLVTSTPLMFVVYYFFINKPVSRLELLSVLVAFIGVILCLLSNIISGDSRINDGNTMAVTGPLASVFGVLICLCSAAFTGVQTQFSKKARQHIPVFLYTMIATGMISFFCFVFSLVIEGTDVFCTESHCFFGFVQYDMALRLLLLGFVCGPFGILLFNYSLKYVSALLYTTVALLESVMTGFISYMLGYESLPTWPVYIGGFIVFIGTILLVIGETKRTEEEKVFKEAGAAEDK